MTRKVKVFKYGDEFDEDDYTYKKELRTIATFHQFGLDVRTFQIGGGSFSTAIVEFDDGKIESVPLDLIQFADKECV